MEQGPPCFPLPAPTSDDLKRVPARLEQLLADKHYLLAVTVLQDASRQLASEGLADLGVLADLRRTLEQRRSVSCAPAKLWRTGMYVR